MEFNKENYTVETLKLGEESLTFRAYRTLTYVEKPVCEEYQRMNIFAPEVYYRGESINGYSLHTAPVFMPNTVGGYKPGPLAEPGFWGEGEKAVWNTIARALLHGYVVAVPAIRGRSLQDEAGKYIGKAPACIVDYKAAVRYLRHFAKALPGDMEKIITNGTSAGGALSSLMGSTGNHPDYEPYLRELGAAEESDAIFAASCYCPIINMENADTAYEWQFNGVYEYHRSRMVMDEAGRPYFEPVDGQMTEAQVKVSKELMVMFPPYVNSLMLSDDTGNELTLASDGEGSFKEYVKSIVLDSANKAIAKGLDLSGKSWLIIENDKAVNMDWEGYARDITRLKNAPSFDDLTLRSGENDLFGSTEGQCRHFTEYALKNSLVNGAMADLKEVKMLNPMCYVEDEQAVKAKHFRIRHGECDRDTSLAISAMFVLKLREAGIEADYHAPWNVPHAGDYDLDELFAWIDGLVRE
ncbi:MAG: alpha/beta hydrolase [Lachnospiraceae bacterium]|nr:alpha/beta hydrolase [Lachnospiraceae bacterium]